MKGIQTVMRHLQNLFRQKQLEDDLSEELRFHLQDETEKNVAAGMTPEEVAMSRCRASGLKIAGVQLR